MTHVHYINGEYVTIEWKLSEPFPQHPTTNFIYLRLKGTDSEGNDYKGVGTFRGQDLQEVNKIKNN